MSTFRKKIKNKAAHKSEIVLQVACASPRTTAISETLFFFCPIRDVQLFYNTPNSVVHFLFSKKCRVVFVVEEPQPHQYQLSPSHQSLYLLKTHTEITIEYFSITTNTTNILTNINKGVYTFSFRKNPHKMSSDRESAPAASIPTTFNVATHHIKLKRDEFMLGTRKIEKHEHAYVVCRVVQAVWDQSFLVHDGTGDMRTFMGDFFEEKDDMPPTGSIIKLWFEFTDYLDRIIETSGMGTGTPDCAITHLEVLHKPDNINWSIQSKAWYELLQEHWEECKQFYYDHCTTITTTAIAAAVATTMRLTTPEFDTPYHILYLTTNDLLYGFEVRSSNKYHVYYQGVKVTHRLALIVGCVSEVKPCHRPLSCHERCKYVTLGDGVSFFSNHFTPAGVHVRPTPPPINATCSILMKLSINTRDAQNKLLPKFVLLSPQQETMIPSINISHKQKR